MKNKKRKEQLKRLAIKKEDNGGRIFQLINSGVLDEAIDRITDEKTPTIITTIVKKGYLTGNEQFIDMISNFIYYFDSKFPTVCHKDLMLELIFENQIPDFLLCKKYWGDNSNMQYFIDSMDKAIVYNFNETLLFIDDNIMFKKFIKNPREINLDNKKDLEAITHFMKSLLWTNLGSYSVMFLFQSFYIKVRNFKKNNKSKNEMEIYKHIIQEVQMHYEILINSYYKNKEILKFVKSYT